MKEVDVEAIVDHLSTEFRKALVEAVQSEVDGAEFNDRSLYRAFKRAIRRKCNTWEQVPDSAVK